MIEVKSTTAQRVHIHMTPESKPGKPAPIDGKIKWEVTAGSATVLEEGEASDGSPIDNANPMFVSVDGVAEESTIVGTADVDMGEGVETISQEFSYVTSLPKAKSFNVAVDSPEEKPEA